MRKSIKSFSLLMASVLGACSIAACGNSTNPTSQTGPTSGGTTTGTTPTSGTTTGTSVGPKHTVEELCEVMLESPYSVTGYDDCNYGLSNPSAVGVVKSDIKDIVEIKADSEYTKILKYEDITLSAVQEYYPNASTLNDFYIVNTLLKQAKDLSDGIKLIKITLPANETLTIDGSLVTGEKALELVDLKNVDIVGDKTRFDIVYNNLAWKGWMQVSNCENINVKGLTVDTSIPSALVGSIASMDIVAKTCTVKVDPYYNNLIAELLINKKPLMEYLEFNNNDRVPVHGGNFFDSGAFDGYEISGDATSGYTILVKFARQVTRTKNNSLVTLSFSEYDTSAINITNGENLVFEDITIHHAPGMGVVAQGTKGLKLNKVNIMVEEGKPDLLTATADGMHFNDVHGDVAVTNSIIEYTHDDALNIKHGYWYQVTGVDSSTRTLSVSKKTGEVNVAVGDRVAIYEKDTFTSRNPSQGYYVINEVNKTPGGYELKVDKRFTDSSQWGTCYATLLSDTPNFVFKNNIVRNKRNRGVLVQVPNALVENNTFTQIGHGSIQAASAMDRFNECTVPNEITIRNNKFVSNIFIDSEPLYGDISIFAISSNATVAPKGTLYGATIENNFVSDNGNAAIALRGTGKEKIKNNLFYDCSAEQISGQQYNCLVYAENNSEELLDGNYNLYTLENDLSGVFCAGLTTQSDITIEKNNTKIDFYKSSKQGADVDISKATGTIVFDGDLSEWDTIGATPIDMIGYSDAKSNERTAEEIEDHFKIKKALMTYTDEGIALAFDIFDNELDFKTVNDFWLGDCIEMFITDKLDMPSADMKVYKDMGGVAQIAFAPIWNMTNYCKIAGDRSNSKYLNKETQITVKFVVNTDGYAAEILLPYSLFGEIKTSIDAQNRIGMAIIVADSERTAGAKSQLDLERVQVGNVPHFVELYKTKTEMMPRYLFK